MLGINNMEVFIMKKKLTKEEKQAKQDRRRKLLELLGGVTDLDGVNALVTDLRKEIIEALYDAH